MNDKSKYSLNLKWCSLSHVWVLKNIPTSIYEYSITYLQAGYSLSNDIGPSILSKSKFIYTWEIII